MAHIPTLVTDLALILMVAGAITLLCKKFHQPVIIGYILAGFLIGPVTDFFPSIGDTQNINTLAEIGVIFMMFALGLEFNLHKMFSVGTTAIVSAAVEILGMTILGYFTGLLLGWGSIDSLFLGGMLGMSSTIITIKVIKDGGYRKQKFANLAIGTLIIEDIFAIFLMLILTTISVSRSDGGQVLLQIGIMLVYLFLWLLLGIFFVPSLMKKLWPLMNNETLLIVSLAICFGMVVLADILGFSAALGAFMAGSILASTAISERIERLVIPLKDLFVAVFFVSVGLIVVPATIAENIIPVLLITLVAIVGKVFLLVLSQVATGQDLSTALHGAFAQTQVGEFSFIIASLGLSLGVTSDFLYPVIVAVAVITTFSTPFLLRFADPCEQRLRKLMSQKLLDDLERRSTEQTNVNFEQSTGNWPAFLKRFFSSFFIFAALIGGIIFTGIKLLLPAAQEMFGS